MNETLDDRQDKKGKFNQAEIQAFPDQPDSIGRDTGRNIVEWFVDQEKSLSLRALGQPREWNDRICSDQVPSFMEAMRHILRAGAGSRRPQI
jgi:hypothetical protein